MGANQTEYSVIKFWVAENANPVKCVNESRMPTEKRNFNKNIWLSSKEKFPGATVNKLCYADSIQYHY